MKTLFHHNIEEIKPKRKNLRNASNPQEIKLWNRLKNNQLGFKFRRQHSVDFYILDFYCPKVRLGIELDGSVHNSTTVYDNYRTRYLEAFDIKILRFWNDEIDNNIEKVLDIVKENLPS